jgi:multiple sugar transport system substrate-binding protein
MLYRKSVWAAHGYIPPATLDDLHALAGRMRADGLIPIAFGDKDGWPAFGMFDILNLRLNGYAFHTGLMDGRERWTDGRVRRVFEVWQGLVPHLQVGALGRTWQDAARTLVNKEAGLFFCGTFAGEQAAGADKDDLDFFPFPTAGTAFDVEKAIDAPINGFMLSRSPKNRDGARRFLEFVGSGAAQDIWTEANPNYVATASDAEVTHYTSNQRKMAAVMAGAGRIAQFLDRDTRPDFAGPNGMQSFLQNWLSDPSQDLEAFLRKIQVFWDSLH